jgi:hypothetical protein
MIVDALSIILDTSLMNFSYVVRLIIIQIKKNRLSYSFEQIFRQGSSCLKWIQYRWTYLE